MTLWITPDWPLPSNVRSIITTRQGQTSHSPYDGLNLADHVGDDSQQVQANRSMLLGQLEGCSSIQWLDQTHSATVINAVGDGLIPNADASITAQSNLGCGVLTADCLPVLMCDSQGQQIAAVHAGWRGLAAGIIRKCVNQFRVPASEVRVFLGPAIGPAAFEVGFDVVEQFYESACSEPQITAISQAFIPSTKPMKFFADIYALARAELMDIGVKDIYGGEFCTYTQADDFYSYRRDGLTGRMLSLIWKID